MIRNNWLVVFTAITLTNTYGAATGRSFTGTVFTGTVLYIQGRSCTHRDGLVHTGTVLYIQGRSCTYRDGLVHTGTVLYIQICFALCRSNCIW